MMSTRNPGRRGGLGRPQCADRLAGYRGTSSPDVTIGTQSLDCPARAGGTRGVESRGRICTRNMEQKGGLGRLQYADRPAEHDGTSSSDLTIEAPIDPRATNVIIIEFIKKSRNLRGHSWT